MDVHTKEERSKNMRAIKSVSKLEDLVTKELWKRGYRFRRNVKSLSGSPDIAIKKYNLVIFIDSCFWHVCPYHGNYPKSNQKFWKDKLERNISRDKTINEIYKKDSWVILRVWEHEIKHDFENTINKITSLIDEAMTNYNKKN